MSTSSHNPTDDDLGLGEDLENCSFCQPYTGSIGGRDESELLYIFSENFVSIWWSSMFKMVILSCILWNFTRY